MWLQPQHDYREKHREHLVYAPNNSGLKSCKTKQWPTVNTSKQPLQLGGMQHQFRGSSCLSTSFHGEEAHTGLSRTSLYLSLWRARTLRREGGSAGSGGGCAVVKMQCLGKGWGAWGLIKFLSGKSSTKRKGEFRTTACFSTPSRWPSLREIWDFFPDFFRISSGQSKFSSGNQHYHIQGKEPVTLHILL